MFKFSRSCHTRDASAAVTEHLKNSVAAGSRSRPRIIFSSQPLARAISLSLLGGGVRNTRLADLLNVAGSCYNYHQLAYRATMALAEAASILAGNAPDETGAAKTQWPSVILQQHICSEIDPRKTQKYFRPVKNRFLMRSQESLQGLQARIMAESFSTRQSSSGPTVAPSRLSMKLGLDRYTNTPKVDTALLQRYRRLLFIEFMIPLLLRTTLQSRQLPRSVFDFFRRVLSDLGTVEPSKEVERLEEAIMQAQLLCLAANVSVAGLRAARVATDVTDGEPSAEWWADGGESHAARCFHATVSAICSEHSLIRDQLASVHASGAPGGDRLCTATVADCELDRQMLRLQAIATSMGHPLRSDAFDPNRCLQHMFLRAEACALGVRPREVLAEVLPSLADGSMFILATNCGYTQAAKVRQTISSFQRVITSDFSTDDVASAAASVEASLKGEIPPGTQKTITAALWESRHVQALSALELADVPLLTYLCRGDVHNMRALHRDLQAAPASAEDSVALTYCLLSGVAACGTSVAPLPPAEVVGWAQELHDSFVASAQSSLWRHPLILQGLLLCTSAAQDTWKTQTVYQQIIMQGSSAMAEGLAAGRARGGSGKLRRQRHRSEAPDERASFDVSARVAMHHERRGALGVRAAARGGVRNSAGIQVTGNVSPALLVPYMLGFRDPQEAARALQANLLFRTRPTSTTIMVAMARLLLDHRVVTPNNTLMTVPHQASSEESTAGRQQLFSSLRQQRAALAKLRQDERSDSLRSLTGEPEAHTDGQMLLIEARHHQRSYLFNREASASDLLFGLVFMTRQNGFSKTTVHGSVVSLAMLQCLKNFLSDAEAALTAHPPAAVPNDMSTRAFVTRALLAPDRTLPKAAAATLQDLASDCADALVRLVGATYAPLAAWAGGPLPPDVPPLHPLGRAVSALLAQHCGELGIRSTAIEGLERLAGGVDVSMLADLSARTGPSSHAVCEELLLQYTPAGVGEVVRRYLVAGTASPHFQKATDAVAAVAVNDWAQVEVSF